MKRLLVTAALAATLGVTGCSIPEDDSGVAARGSDTGADAEASVDTEDVEPDEPDEPEPDPEPETYKPSKGDFQLLVKETSRSCFGSAGCNVEYTVGLKWRGPKGVTLDDDYDLYFKVVGGDDGGQTDTMEVTRKLKYAPIDNFASTGSESAQLTAELVRLSKSSGF